MNDEQQKLFDIFEAMYRAVPISIDKSTLEFVISPKKYEVALEIVNSFQERPIQKANGKYAITFRGIDVRSVDYVTRLHLQYKDELCKAK